MDIPHHEQIDSRMRASYQVIVNMLCQNDKTAKAEANYGDRTLAQWTKIRDVLQDDQYHAAVSAVVKVGDLQAVLGDKTISANARWFIQKVMFLQCLDTDSDEDRAMVRVKRGDWLSNAAENAQRKLRAGLIALNETFSDSEIAVVLHLGPGQTITLTDPNGTTHVHLGPPLYQPVIHEIRRLPCFEEDSVTAALHPQHYTVHTLTTDGAWICLPVFLVLVQNAVCGNM